MFSRISRARAIPGPACILLAACLLGNVASPAVAQDNASLRAADVVDAEGRLHLPDGYAGSIDVAGYTLDTAADGAPLLVPEAADPTALIGIPFGQVRHGCGPLGVIRAAVRMPNGDLVLGGDFDVCGDEPTKDVIRWDGRRWHAMGVLVYGIHGVYAMALKGNDLYVAGDSIFRTVENNYTQNIARWDGAQWHSVTCATCIPRGTIFALAFVGDLLYVGGDFGTIDLGPGAWVNANHLAILQGDTWHALQSDAHDCTPGTDGPVKAIATDGVNVYVGGDFTHALECGPSISANHVARWDGAHWSALGSGGTNGVDGIVNALLHASGSLYVGGSFNVAGSLSAASVARWDGAAWHALGSGGVLGEVDALAFSDNRLYAGGNFRATSDGPALRVARFAQGAWSAMGQGVGTLDNGDVSAVSAMLANASGLAVFGDFTQTPTMPEANRTAQWNGTAWAPFVDASETRKIDGRVNVIAVRGADLFVGGRITQAGATPVHNVARWNGSAWSALGGSGAEGVDAEVFALTVTANNVYAGGDFAHAGNQPAAQVARWDGTAWHAMGQGTNGRVVALAANSDNSVYAAGPFTHAGGERVNAIARWTGSAWTPLPGSGGTVGVCGTIHALAAAGDDRGVYVGGLFPQPPCGDATDVGHAVSLWNGYGWFPLREGGAGGFEATGNSNSNEVFALLRDGDALYVGGYFPSFAYDGALQQIPGTVKWNITPQRWELLASRGFNTFSGWPTGIAKIGTTLYVATYDLLQQYVALPGNPYWRTAVNTQLLGADSPVLGVRRGELFLGGDFIACTVKGNPIQRVASAGIVAFVGDGIFASGFDG